MTTVMIDPLSQYTDHAPKDIFNWCGFIPSWIASKPKGANMLEHLTACYGYGEQMEMGGLIDEDGVYTYPEDPDLYPIAKFDNDGWTVYQYPHGIVAVVRDEECSIVRMA